MIIAVDFDGTVVDHRFPDVGKDVPGAAKWLRQFVQSGSKIILWTMRSSDQDNPGVLHDAIAWFSKHDIPLFGVNENPEQLGWTRSPKAYAHLYIDDAAFGCPLKENPQLGGRPYVNWNVVGPVVMQMIKDGR